jgi:glycosyltransferase involved in cell wall biosynthesis
VSPPIVHVASGREWRGGQRQVWLLARELARRDISQVVVTSTGSELAHRLTHDGIRVHPGRWKIGLDLRVVPAILGELRPPVVLHAHDSHALTLAGLSALIRRTPVVVTRRVTFPLQRKFFYHRACRIIAISRAVREALQRDGIPSERMVVIPSAVDPGVSECRELNVRAEHQIPSTARLAVHFGALTPEKDHRTLILAAARLVRDLPDLHWVIAGEGPLRRELEAQIQGLAVQDRIHLIGALDDPHRLLTAADIFVLSSVSEGLGSSILAAMVRGVPVVATRVGGVPDLLEAGAGIMVPPGDPAAIAAAVRRVLTDQSLRASLVNTARRKVKRFSAAAMADQVMTVYRSCAHSLDGS